MKKKSLLWISALLLMLAGCSSNDDEFNEVNLLPMELRDMIRNE